MKKLRDLLTEAEIFAGGDSVRVKGGGHGRVLSVKKTLTGVRYLVILSDGSENTYGANDLSRVEDTFDDSDHQEREVFKGTPILNAHGSHAKKPINEHNLFEQRKPTMPHRNQMTMDQKTDPHAFDIDHVPEMHDHFKPDNQHIVPFKPEEKEHDPYSTATPAQKKVNTDAANELHHAHQVVKKLAEPHEEAQKKHPGFEEMRRYTSSSHDMNNFLVRHYTKKMNKEFKPKEFEAHEDHKVRMRHYKEEHQRNELKAMKLDKLGKDHPLSHDVTVYHGAGFDVEKAASADPERKLHSPAFLSTSTSKEISRGFGNSTYDEKTQTHHRHMLRIHLPKGHPSITAGDMSNCAGEHEIILARHTTLQVAKKPKIVRRGSEHIHVYDAHPVPNELQDAPNQKRDKYEKSVQRGINIAQGKATDEDIHSALSDKNATHEEHAGIINNPELFKKHSKAILNNMPNLSYSNRRSAAREFLKNPKVSSTTISKLVDSGLADGLGPQHKNLGPQHLKGLIDHDGPSAAIEHLAKGDLTDEQFNHLSSSSAYSHLAMASPKFNKKHIPAVIDSLKTDADGYDAMSKAKALVDNPNFTKKHFEQLTEHPTFAKLLANHKHAGPKLLNTLANSDHWSDRLAAAKSPNLSAEHVQKLLTDDDGDVAQALRETHGDKITSEHVATALTGDRAGNVDHRFFNKLNSDDFKKVLDHHQSDDPDTSRIMRNMMHQPEAKNHIDSFINHPNPDVVSSAVQMLPLEKHHIDNIMAHHDGRRDTIISQSDFFQSKDTHQHTLVNKALDNGDYHSAKWWADQKYNTPPEMYKKIGQHFIDHGVHHEGATEDYAGQKQVEAMGQMARHLNTEQVNALLKTGVGPHIASHMAWGDHDHRPMDQMFDGVSDKVKSMAAIMTNGYTPNLSAHIHKDAKPEDIAKDLSNYGITSKFSPEQLKATVDHVFNKDVSNFDNDNDGDQAYKDKHTAMRQMKDILQNSNLRPYVTQDHVNKMYDQFMTHKQGVAGMAMNAEYATMEAAEHFPPKKELLDRIANGEGPREMVSHVYRHLDKDQAETWMHKGKPHSWTSEHYMEKYGKHFSPETLHHIANNKDSKHYPWVSEQAQKLIDQKQKETNDGIKYRAPANPDLG